MITFLGVMYLSAVHGLELNMWVVLGAFFIDVAAWDSIGTIIKSRYGGE